MDAFRTLTGGSNFDRKRFKSDMNHFQPAAAASTLASTSAAQVPAELDFFAEPANDVTEGKAASKKDKKRKRSVEEASSTRESARLLSVPCARVLTLRRLHSLGSSRCRRVDQETPHQAHGA